MLGISGLVHGGVGPAPPAERSTDAVVDVHARLGEALSTLVDAVTSLKGPSILDGALSDSARDAVDSAIDTLRSVLVPAAARTPSSLADASTTGAGLAPVEPSVPRPNLDALNRVLSHYAAQSAAANVPYVIGD